jgi:uncharacterized pyridoxal phosphate-containing UPF0001 family protein
MNTFGEPRPDAQGVVAGAPTNLREAAPLMSVSAALIEVNGLMAMAMSMGNNDYELGAFNQIVQKLQTNKYENPADAVREARSIIDNKLIR